MKRALGHCEGRATRIAATWLLASLTLLLCSCRTMPGAVRGGLAGRTRPADSAVAAAHEPTTPANPQTLTISDQEPAPDSARQGDSNQSRLAGSEAESNSRSATPATSPEAKAPSPPAQQTSTAARDSLADKPGGRHSRGAKQGAASDYLPLAAAPAVAIRQPTRYPFDGRYPLPEDEHLFDGGDKNQSVGIAADWSVRGLDVEDTIGHFDTLDGRTVVVPSNRVALYAPRFAAVRKVSGAAMHERHLRVAAYEREIGPQRVDDTRVPESVTQQLQPIGQIGSRPAAVLEESQRGFELANDEGLLSFRNDFRPYEDLQVVRRGVFEQSEKARLAESIEAAIAWTGDQMAQAVVDGKNVAITATSVRAEAVYKNERPPGVPQMRVIKLASRKTARPGETVEFTLRFDNLGDELIGNVTIVDSLTPRLEYVDGSAECNLKHEFFTQENETESLVLRWEITDPLPVGEGGIIRFQCRVR